MHPLTLTDILVRILAALLCGAVLGWEREARGKAAGFRTNMLIAQGAAVFTMLSIELASRSSGPGAYDPLRVLQGVIGGIGFLGAGAIIRSGGSIHGMTTAATIWVVGAAGVACGIGTYNAFAIAFTSVVACFIVLTLLEIVAKRLIHDNQDPQHERPQNVEDDQNL